MKNNIKVLRATHNMTQADLANHVEVSRQRSQATRLGEDRRRSFGKGRRN